MLRTINQGLVLNAIMESGFGCTYDHFDIARFVKNDGQGNTARLEVTSMHLQEAPPASELADFLKKRDRFDIFASIGYDLSRLPQMLAEVALRLASEGCILSLPDEQMFPHGKFPGGACALITRTVVVPSINPRRSLIIQVTVRAHYEKNS
jgi:hypothetical protein